MKIDQYQIRYFTNISKVDAPVLCLGEIIHFTLDKAYPHASEYITLRMVEELNYSEINKLDWIAQHSFKRPFGFFCELMREGLNKGVFPIEHLQNKFNGLNSLQVVLTSTFSSLEEYSRDNILPVSHSSTVFGFFHTCGRTIKEYTWYYS